MKNLITLLFILFVGIGSSHAQIDRFRFPAYTPKTPPIDLRFNCADLTVKLELQRIYQIQGNQFRATFKATVKNVGRVDFNNQTNPVLAELSVTDNHPNIEGDVILTIPSMRVGESYSTYLSTSWSADWRVAPSVIFSLNAHPADCNRNNNQVVLTHTSILQYFRIARLPRLSRPGF